MHMERKLFGCDHYDHKHSLSLFTPVLIGHIFTAAAGKGTSSRADQDQASKAK